MRLLVNAYDLEGVPLAELKSMGWRGARRDVRTPAEAAYVLNEHQVAGMDALLLVNAPPAEAVRLAVAICGIYPLTRFQMPFAIEVGNEWDQSVDPDEAGAAWEEVARRAPAGVTIVTAGITSLSSDSLAWLRKAMPALPWLSTMVCGFHAYTSAILNEGNRRAELQQLRSIIGDRRAWNTETGWHMASKAKPFPLCWSRAPGLSEEQVLANLTADVRIHAEYGVETYTVYQLNDGPRDTPEDRYGIRTMDGRWKKQAALPGAVEGSA